MDTETLLAILKIVLIIASVLVIINVIRRSTNWHKFGYLLLVLWILSISSIVKNNDLQLFFNEHKFISFLFDSVFPIFILAYCGIGMIEGFIRWFNLDFTFYKFFRSKVHLNRNGLEKEGELRYATYEDYKIFEEDTGDFKDMEVDEQTKGSLFKLILKIMVGVVIGKMVFPDSWEGIYACAGIAVGLEFFDKIVPFVIIGNSSLAIGY